MPSVSSQDFHTSQVSEDDAIGVEDLNDNASFALVDDLDGKISDLQGVSVLFHVSISLDEGQTHLLELSNLAAKDPEFYKYLQANDRELLEFDPEATGEDEEMADGDIESEEEKIPTLTKEHLRQWQKTILEVCGILPCNVNCHFLRSLFSTNYCSILAAPVTEGTSQTVNRIPSSRSYERE